MNFRLPTALTAIALAITAASGSAWAEAPMVKTQAPGYYRTMVGDFEVTAISDGTVKLPMLKLLTNAKPGVVAKALKAGFLNETVETSDNAYLVNTGSKLVLIDTGAAGLFGPTLGNLLTNMQAAGYKPEQVDEIYITHMHPDHVGGLMDKATMAFPNAVLRINKMDTDYWLSEANLKAAPEVAKGFFQGAMASVNPYVAAGKLKIFEGNTDLVPGVRAIAAYGHTPGHTVYQFDSNGQTAVFWGDLVHSNQMQLNNPKIAFEYDFDQKQAIATRETILAQAAKNQWLVGGAHIPFPGLGYVHAMGNGYDWNAVKYQSTLK